MTSRTQKKNIKRRCRLKNILKVKVNLNENLSFNAILSSNLNITTTEQELYWAIKKSMVISQLKYIFIEFQKSIVVA